MSTVGNPVSTTELRKIRIELQCLELARKYLGLTHDHKLLVDEVWEVKNRLRACEKSIARVESQLMVLLGWPKGVVCNLNGLPAPLVDVLAHLIITAATPPHSVAATPPLSNGEGLPSGIPSN